MPSAERDIREVLLWSAEAFGVWAARRYRALLKQALRGIAGDPTRPGSHERPELAWGLRTFHLSFSQERARTDEGVLKRPRHFVLYRSEENPPSVHVLRTLHDARDLGAQFLRVE